MSFIELPNAAHEIDGATYIKYNGTEAHVTIPAGIAAVGDSAFAGCSFLKSVTIPEGVTEIGPSAFEGCRRLQSIHLPPSVASIRFAAFEGCGSLESIAIPDGVTVIEKWCFKDCAALTSITLPHTVTVLSPSAFRDCAALREITIPEGVTAVGESCFRGCIALTDLTLPDSLKSIGRQAFRDCVALERVELHERTAMGEEVFRGCGNVEIIKRTDNRKKAPAPKPKLPRRKALLDDWLIIDGVLCSYSGTDAHVEIPHGVTSVSGFAFRNPNPITAVTVPDTVTEIEDGCFRGWENLTEAIVTEGSYAEGYFAELGIPCRYADTVPTEDIPTDPADDIEELRLDLAETERLRREAEEAEQRRAAEEAERLQREQEEAERIRREAEEAQARREAEEAERLRKEAERLRNDPKEAERLRREAEQREFKAEQARQKRRELAAQRKQYDKLYDEIARQDYIIATNSGLFGQSARTRKDAEKRRTLLQAQLKREFPNGRPK